MSDADTRILPTPTTEIVFSSSVKKEKTECQLGVPFLYLHGTFKNCQRDQTISTLQILSHAKILKCKYSVSLSFIIPSSTWPDMESVSSIILSEIFIVGENHMNSFLRKVTLWSTHFHVSSLFLKTITYFWSRTSDLTTSKVDTERSWLHIEHPMHLLFYLVSPTSSQFKTQVNFYFPTRTKLFHNDH